jgi:thioredoxin reductase (NADPH)
MSVRDVLIVGAGPSGLATAIAAKQHGLDYVIVEKGVLVNSIFNFPDAHGVLHHAGALEIGGLPLVTPYDKPTRLEALRYYRRVVDTYELPISFHEKVTSIERGATVASSSRPRPTAAPRGCAKPRGGARDRLLRLSQLSRHSGRRAAARIALLHRCASVLPAAVVVVGGKNSAAEAALELFRAGAHVTLVHRHAHLGDRSSTGCGPTSRTASRKGRSRALQRVRD